jgi:hypothetical protein
VIKGAITEGDRRYQLWRIWEEQKPLLLYILLNPSYANAEENDRTVSKLIHFSKIFGFGGFYLGNIYSYINPYPSVLKNKIMKKERHNIKHLKTMIQKCEKVVFGWGNAGELPGWLDKMVEKVYCFGRNQNGSPKHPLYLSYKTPLIRYLKG